MFLQKRKRGGKMIQIALLFIIGATWILQGFIRFQFQFALEKKMFYLVGYIIQSFALFYGTLYVLLGTILIRERASSHDKDFSVGIYYNIMIAVGLLLVIGTTL